MATLSLHLILTDYFYIGQTVEQLTISIYLLVGCGKLYATSVTWYRGFVLACGFCKLDSLLYNGQSVSVSDHSDHLVLLRFLIFVICCCLFLLQNQSR